MLENNIKVRIFLFKLLVTFEICNRDNIRIEISAFLNPTDADAIKIKCWSYQLKNYRF